MSPVYLLATLLRQLETTISENLTTQRLKPFSAKLILSLISFSIKIWFLKLLNLIELAKLILGLVSFSIRTWFLERVASLPLLTEKLEELASLVKNLAPLKEKSWHWYDLGEDLGWVHLLITWTLKTDPHGLPRWYKKGWRRGNGVEIAEGVPASKEIVKALHDSLLSKTGYRTMNTTLYRYRFVQLATGVNESLSREDQVHHKDRDTTNDCAENLETLKDVDHAALHQREGDPLTYHTGGSLHSPAPASRYYRIPKTLSFIRGRWAADPGGCSQ
jgi:hypothetical protein